MGKIYFLRKWNGDQKENTWSGTPNGILTALNEKVGKEQIESVNIVFSKFDFVLLRGLRGFLKLLSIDSCEIIDNLIENHIAKKKLQGVENDPIIVFGEYKTSKTANMYIYLDCSVDYAYRCRKNRDIFSTYVPLGKTRKHSLLSLRVKKARTFYQQCRGIFTMGQWLADDLVNYAGVMPSKVHCVGGGTNVPAHLIDSTRKMGNKFLFVGKDFERKNGLLVVEAFLRLNSKHSGKFELYIAGPKEWPLLIDIPEGVHFLGLKSTNELSEYYNLCDVFVMPSQFEAYGIVFAEALIYGLPVIARNAFSMCEFVTHGDNGYLLETNSAEELASLMEYAITNDQMRKKVIDDKNKYIAQYSWATVANRICEVIENDGYKI